MQDFNHLKNILGFLTDVDNFNDCFVDDGAEYNFEAAKELFDEHLYNLLLQAGTDDVTAKELSYRLTNKFYYHPDCRMQAIKTLRYDNYTTYLPSEDITIIWQDMWYEEECIQRSLVGFYYGEPDDKSTTDFSIMPFTAQFY